MGTLKMKDRLWGLRQVVTDYLTKPVNARELMQKSRPLNS